MNGPRIVQTQNPRTGRWVILDRKLRRVVGTSPVKTTYPTCKEGVQAPPLVGVPKPPSATETKIVKPVRRPRLRLRTLLAAFFRLSDRAVCEASTGKGLVDFHDYPDSVCRGLDRHHVLLSKRCGKEFVI